MSKSKKTNRYVRSSPQKTALVPNTSPGNHVRTRELSDTASAIATQVLPGTDPLPDRILKSTLVRQQTFNGPIPHPDIFRKYGEVIPDAPERILKVFEADSAHLRDLQMGALNAQKSDNRRVHWMAYSLIGGGYAMSALFAWMNKDVLAGIVLTTTIIGTVTGFMQQRAEADSEKIDDEKSAE